MSLAFTGFNEYVAVFFFFFKDNIQIILPDAFDKKKINVLDFKLSC